MSATQNAEDAGRSGLEGVVVADTVMSRVDGLAGHLVIRGYDVEVLAASARFEDVCALLWQGSTPGSEAGREAGREIGQARLRAHARLPGLGGALKLPNAMEALRAGIAQLSVEAEPELDPRYELVGACAVYAAAWARLRAGQQPVAPDPGRGHAEDYLRMVRGEEPGERAAALDAYLVTVADHGMNASTFTARVAASTDSDPVSIVTAALCSLKGPLHGGAPGPVLDMLDAVDTPDAAAEWVEAELAAGRRIMGIGHRVYRVRDPRAAVLERQVERLEIAGVALDRLSFARAVEKVAVDALQRRHPDRPLEANVEFYTAVLLDAVGLPRELFTPTFACARTAGWLAHAAEQKQNGRLIRPACRYTGPEPV
ncbi:MAG: citrate synthase [Deltaproteobacteria bacterium]|nr:citrate synthase [Deltaproteobacteria bacterium]MBW2412931.1 citrate synthase [Deltaproteobacteria bacterium]